jgi:site-specific recombinase XerD
MSETARDHDVRRSSCAEIRVSYLVAERGLAASTIGNYRAVAVRFLATEGEWPDGIAGVRAEQVSEFVLAEAARRSAGSLNNVTTGLRALLRWLYVEGYTPTSLAGAVRLLQAGGIVGCRERCRLVRLACCWRAVTGVPTWVVAILRF